RVDVLLVKMFQRLRQACLLIGHNGSAADRLSKSWGNQIGILNHHSASGKLAVEIGQLPGLVIEGGMQFVAQPKVQSQFWRDLPIVLNEVGGICGIGIEIRPIERLGSLNREAKKEVCKGVTAVAVKARYS